MIKCCCCEKDSGVDKHNPNNLINWGKLLSVRNGLEILYVCPSCVSEMKEHVKVIIDKLPSKDRDYIHWGSLISMAGLKEK